MKIILDMFLFLINTVILTISFIEFGSTSNYGFLGVGMWAGGVTIAIVVTVIRRSKNGYYKT